LPRAPGIVSSVESRVSSLRSRVTSVQSRAADASASRATPRNFREIMHTHRRSEEADMARYGTQYGPDITFLGVERCDWSDPETYGDADVVILGAPFDGGTSHRSGTRFGPQYIRQSCYLPHDGSRPSLALRVDGLQDLTVYDAGDVMLFSGDAERSV